MGIGFFANVFAEDDYNTYIEKLSESIFQNIPDMDSKNKKKIIGYFCDKVLNYRYLWKKSLDYDEFYYSPQQSLFMLALCSDEISDYKSQFKNNYIFNNEENTYMTWHYLEDFSLISLWTCDPKKWIMRNCDLLKVIPRMFDEIIEEYISLKHAKIYGLQTDKEELMSEEKQANAFSEKWFSVKFCDLNGWECLYSESMKRMKNYLKQAKRLLRSVKYVSYDNILADSIVEKEKVLASEYLCDATKKWNRNKTYNIVMCGLYSTEDDNMTSFLNLLYNEMLYYRVFVSYYSALLRYDADLVKTISGKPKYDYDSSSEINELEKKFSWSQKAIAVSTKMLNEMQMTFPLHMGFMMYYEYLMSLRKELAKIVTPVYTLYDKLRNVQKAE